MSNSAASLDRWIDDALARGITIVRLYVTLDVYRALDVQSYVLKSTTRYGIKAFRSS